ncbi:MAG: nuclear transport factor 2 family protein [Chloroflexota bacterium]|nr:nuclear transport factor 2 family protein [Chloroflexota bacterium]
MEAKGSRAIFERYMAALNRRDLATLAELLHPEVEDSYPQSGELIRGPANLQAIIANYPGEYQDLGQHRVIGGEDRFISTPMFTVLRVEGSDDVFTGLQQARYPDGSVWFVVLIAELRDGLIYRTQSLWAPTFDPPAWRAQWVELQPRPGE